MNYDCIAAALYCLKGFISAFAHFISVLLLFLDKKISNFVYVLVPYE